MFGIGLEVRLSMAEIRSLLETLSIALFDRFSKIAILISGRFIVGNIEFVKSLPMRVKGHGKCLNRLSIFLNLTLAPEPRTISSRQKDPHLCDDLLT